MNFDSTRPRVKVGQDTHSVGQKLRFRLTTPPAQASLDLQALILKFILSPQAGTRQMVSMRPETAPDIIGQTTHMLC